MSRHYSSRKRVQVTGGAVILGSHLIDLLLGKGHDVLCVDNFFTCTRENIPNVRGHERFEFIRHDVTFPLFVEVHEICNLVCPASPVYYQHDPAQKTKTSVQGVNNMLGLAKRVGARILPASTNEVYGDPAVHPQAEDYWGNFNSIGPLSCYDESKRCAESLIFDYHRQHTFEIKVARIFNTYGPRMHPSDGRVVSNFIVQALAGEPITIYGDGQQTRSFCFVDDLVRQMVALMESPAEVAGPISIGNPGEFNMIELAGKVNALTGSSSNLVMLPPPADDPKQRRPVISRAQQDLGWEPTLALVEGLERTIAYFWGNLEL